MWVEIKDDRYDRTNSKIEACDITNAFERKLGWNAPNMLILPR
jgi:hypothetical protein